jgi:hypothetical protein
MKNQLVKLSLITAVAAALAILPAPANAQTSTNKTASPKKPTAEKSDSATKKGHPFRGKLAAVDKVAKTITLGKSTYQITSETKIKKADKPATLDDATLGEEVTGFAKPGDGGKFFASSLNIGGKSGSKTSTTKTEKKTTTK